MLLMATITLLRDGRPVLFSQERAGYRERPFRLYKFRSMSNAVNSAVNSWPNAARLTMWGRFLRTSVWTNSRNSGTFCAEMSLVGPRPLPVIYLPRYSLLHHRRHLVRPGITGWAQINRAQYIDLGAKVRSGCWYVDHRSMEPGSEILWLTGLRLFRPQGISPKGQVTAGCRRISRRSGSVSPSGKR